MRLIVENIRRTLQFSIAYAVRCRHFGAAEFDGAVHGAVPQRFGLMVSPYIVKSTPGVLFIIDERSIGNLAIRFDKQFGPRKQVLGPLHAACGL